MSNRLTKFIETENGLRIVLTDEGKNDSPETFEEAIEYELCNGWELLQPEEIGALTSAPILATNTLRDDDGGLVDAGRVYWFPNYCVENELETLLLSGEVFFQAA
jgi:hypothetical protein